MITTHLGGLAAAALISAALLAGCGSSSEPAASTVASTATTGTVGGMAVCDGASLVTAANAAGEVDDRPLVLDTPDSFQCADGWAYAYIDNGDYTGTWVFEAEGQFWIPKDRATVCTAPGDQVPASIYKDACETN